jgi:hypothetical protein
VFCVAKSRAAAAAAATAIGQLMRGTVSIGSDTDQAYA